MADKQYSATLTFEGKDIFKLVEIPKGKQYYVNLAGLFRDVADAIEKEDENGNHPISVTISVHYSTIMSV